MATIFRTTLSQSDPSDIESLVRATGFFSSEEIAIARELADDGLVCGSSSHYRFILADLDKTLAGYACFGPVPCTRSAWDLYWIAVAPSAQGKEVGSELLKRLEMVVIGAAGTHIYVDTSSREQYVRTRAFYLRRGYHAAANLPDFYAPGDGKIVFSKVLGLTTT